MKLQRPKLPLRLRVVNFAIGAGCGLFSAKTINAGKIHLKADTGFSYEVTQLHEPFIFWAFVLLLAFFSAGFFYLAFASRKPDD